MFIYTYIYIYIYMCISIYRETSARDVWRSMRSRAAAASAASVFSFTTCPTVKVV